MFKKTTLFVLFGFFLMAFCATPQHAARANALDSTTGSFVQNCNDKLQTAAASAAAEAAKNSIKAMSKVAPLVPKTAMCLQRLSDLFNTLASMSDPFSLITSMITNWLVGMLDSFLAAICNAVLSTITQIMDYAVSQANLCMPLQDKNFNFNTNLGLENKACSGSPVFGISLDQPGSTPKQGWQLIWGK